MFLINIYISSFLSSIFQDKLTKYCSTNIHSTFSFHTMQNALFPACFISIHFSDPITLRCLPWLFQAIVITGAGGKIEPWFLLQQGNNSELRTQIITESLFKSYTDSRSNQAGLSRLRNKLQRQKEGHFELRKQKGKGNVS